MAKKEKDTSYEMALDCYDMEEKVRITPFISKKEYDKLPKKLKDKLKGKKPKI